MKTFIDVIDAWPSRAEFAGDCGVPYNTAKQWHTRGSIPSSYWFRIVAAAGERGINGVNLTTLARLAQEKRSAA